MTIRKACVKQEEYCQNSKCYRLGMLARSIVVGMCHVHRSDTPELKKEWRAIRTFDGSLQKTRAEELLKEVGLRGDKSCGPCKYELIQDTIYPSGEMSRTIFCRIQSVKSSTLDPGIEGDSRLLS